MRGYLKLAAFCSSLAALDYIAGALKFAQPVGWIWFLILYVFFAVLYFLEQREGDR